MSKHRVDCETPMTSTVKRWSVALAALCGAFVALVDNVAFGGEVSPIVIVALTFVATALLGTLDAHRRWLRLLAVWIWLPAAHLVKHVFHLPDTLHPNTYASIAMLGAFSLIIAIVGTGFGILVSRWQAASRKLPPTA